MSTKYPHMITCDPWWWLAKTYRVFNKYESILLQCILFIFILDLLYTVSRDSSGGIATHYGLDDPGIESRWEARFSAPVHTGPGAHPASYIMRTGSLPPGVKRPERGGDFPPPSQCRGQRKSRAVILLSLWALIPCSRINFPFYYYTTYRVIMCHKVVSCLLYSTGSSFSVTIPVTGELLFTSNGDGVCQ